MSSSVSERLTHELGTQSILKLLLRFSIPSLISNLMFTPRSFLLLLSCGQCAP